MSDELDNDQMFRIKTMANIYLLRAVTIRLMLMDPEFAKDARQWLDTLFGAISVSEHTAAREVARGTQFISALREEYMRVLALNEEQARIATSVAKPKSLRRRIFDWLERG